MEKPSVLILGAHNKAALPLIESAHAHGRRVIAASPLRWCLGFYSRCVSRRLRYPSAEHAPAACLDSLLRYLARHPVDMLVPVGDSGTELVARHQDALRRYTRLALPPYAVFRAGRDKILTLQAAARAGVAIPRTWYPEGQALTEIAREAPYPCLIKPAISAGARGITVVRSAEELLGSFAAVDSQFGRAFVQDFVPQTGMQYKVDMVVGKNVRPLAAVAYEKRWYYPPSGGSSVLNRSVSRPDIICLAARVLTELGWYGFCDFDFIEDPRDGVVKLMEINPRYPESLRVVYAAGVDVGEIAFQLAHDREPPPQLGYQVDRWARFLPGDLLWFLASPDRWRHWRQFVDFFSPKVQYQLGSACDPGPLIGYLLENLVVLFNRKQRAARFRLDQTLDRRQPGRGAL